MSNSTGNSLRALGVVAGLAFFASALAQTDAAATKFLTDAIRGNIAEVKMGELAQQRGLNQGCARIRRDARGGSHGGSAEDRSAGEDSRRNSAD